MKCFYQAKFGDKPLVFLIKSKLPVHLLDVSPDDQDSVMFVEENVNVEMLFCDLETIGIKDTL